MYRNTNNYRSTQTVLTTVLKMTADQKTQDENKSKNQDTEIETILAPAPLPFWLTDPKKMESGCELVI